MKRLSQVIVARWTRVLCVVLTPWSACGAPMTPPLSDAAGVADVPKIDPAPVEVCKAATLGDPGGPFQSWVAAPNTHPNVPNVSYAGYRQGAPLPSQPRSVRVHITDFGATADSESDASDAIEAAIKAVAATGGEVIFPEGELRLQRPIMVGHSNVLLIGAGAGQTTLVFERNLDDSYGTNASGTSSRWSWLGGMVWFAPTGLRGAQIQPDQLDDNWHEGWTRTGSPLAITRPAARGDERLSIAAGHDLRPGQRVLIEVNSDETLLKHLAGGGAFADAQDWSEERAGWLLPPRRPSVVWPVAIAAVDADTIVLRQPLRFELRSEWSPRLSRLGAVIEESGIVGMTLVMQRTATYSRRQHHQEPGWNGVFLENAWNCFVDDVEIVNAESSVLITSSKHITVRGLRISATTDALQTQHHGSITRMFSNDILMEDFTIDANPIHGINVESYSMGNVWSRGTMAHGTWDLHAGLPIDNVLTEVTLYNDGGPGGRKDAGPRAGARHVVWNVAVTNEQCTVLGEADQLPSGAIVGLRGCTPSDPAESACLVIDSGIDASPPAPPNLYEAQHAVRKCASTQ